ncbi:MAG: acetyltransferase [Dysgonamonadaceae bacterium]|jgi:sugar O-acyltransferase (sialic acid O-acetyltransferase NeuD family)|nr:acetyltransferase [Dysgonamonadaceae bacterium]
MKTDNTVNDIAIYGAGGYGREVACLINAINRVSPAWNIIGFFDDGSPIGQKNEYGEILGGLPELNRYSEKLYVVMAIASPKMLKNIVEQITNPFIDFPNIIAPDVLFLDKTNLSLGKGNVIGFHSAVSCNIQMGNFNRMNTNVFLGHDVSMGNYNMFNPSVRISGEVSIGDCNFFGVSSIVLQQKNIGNHVTVGTNSVIVKKTKNNTTYIGNPAVELKY